MKTRPFQNDFVCSFQKYTVMILAYFIVCVAIIFMYGKYRCTHPKFRDPLMKPVGPKALGIDGWSFTHFLFFALLGYMYPHKFICAQSLGVGWELFEQVAGENRPGWMGGFGDCVTTDPKDIGSWWFGRWTDIVMNMSGFVVGAYFSPHK